MDVEPPETGIFETYTEYSKLLSGAHRRQVTPLSTPAVIRHLAFWNPAKLGPQELKESEATSGADHKCQGRPAKPSAALRVEAADRCVAAVYAHLVRSRAKPENRLHTIRTNSDVEVDGRKVIALFGSVIGTEGGEPGGCPAQLRADSYRAIKFSFLWHGIKTTLSFELHTEFLTLTIVLDLSESKEEHEVAAIAASKDPVPGDLYRALSQLSTAAAIEAGKCPPIHNDLYHRIWDRAEQELLLPLRHLKADLGPRFVDFRGVALSPNGCEEDAAFAPPFTRQSSESGTGLERDPQCRLEKFDSLWAFVTCAMPASTEFTLSRFLDDRAFYATALGYQPDILARPHNDPLYYLLYEDTLNPWQLGRLIYRVHRAGTVRIAAIMHFDALRSATETLARVEGNLEQATWEMSKFGDSAKNPELRKRLLDQQVLVEADLSKLSELKLDGTLEARIERSRYYVRQFERVSGALRIKRVVGFQPYDEFVTQRMGPVFESIDSLGRAFERVRHDRAALVGRIQTLDSLRHEQLIAEAQRIADIALSCALGPYYVGYIIAHGLAGAIPERMVWLTATLFGFTMFALIRLARSAAGDERKQRFARGLKSRVSRFALALIVAIPVAALLDAAVLPAAPAVHAQAEPGPPRDADADRGGAQLPSSSDRSD
ncbi:MAG: hypothetical protein QOI38_2249 [Sphingomonadales bacterium]|nr:hypothetical protein [Sphingomonadales bacterium]